MQDSQQNLRFGQPVKRFEDGRFLTGKGNYVSDIQIPHLVQAKILRALVPAGIIKSLDISEARRSKGVIKILTANDSSSARYFSNSTNLLNIIAASFFLVLSAIKLIYKIKINII